MNKIKVAFFGSSSFSIPTLKQLFQDSNISVESIITMPPAEKNRGKKLSNNVVHTFALSNNFPENLIFTPKTLKNNVELVEDLKKQDLDFIIVVAYGKIIPKNIIDLPKYEILNLHPSALPKYRGAAPIERAIENGEREIDICIMKVDIGLDTGDVACRKKYTIANNKGALEVVPQIAEIGATLMVETIKKIINNEIFFEKQQEEGVVYANKIEKNELLIDLTNERLSAITIFNKIRAFNNSGCCYFIYNETRIKIITADIIKGKFVFTGFNKNDGTITFKDGIIKPILIQKEGKKPMKLKDFLNGIR